MLRPIWAISKESIIKQVEIIKLSDDGDYTETCWSCFNVNVNVNVKIVFKAIQLCISWWIKKNFDNKLYVYDYT
jgi:hypothetical protein